MTDRDFELALGKLTPLLPEEARELHLLFDSGNAVEQRSALDALLQKMGTLSPQAAAELRLGMLNPDASVRWMSIQILAGSGDLPLQLTARLLRDDSPKVREAAEQALVGAGHPAIAPLAQVVAEEPCYSEAKLVATRALGALGDPCGIDAVAGALIKNPAGCYDHETAFTALRRMGPPAIDALALLLKYRLLKGRAYLALLEYGSADLKSALLPVIADPGREITDRLHFAEQAEILLGTEAILGELETFYFGVTGDPSLPPEIVEKARSAWTTRPRGSFMVAALSRERAQRDYDPRRFIEEDELEAAREREKKLDELLAAQRASAAGDRRNATHGSESSLQPIFQSLSSSSGSSPSGSASGGSTRSRSGSG